IQKFLAQHFTRKSSEFFAGVERAIGLKLPLEQGGDTLAAVVDCRSDEMRWLLIGNLQNELCQVSFRDFNADGFEVMIQTNLFRGHALALHGKTYLMILASLGDVMRSLVPGTGKKEVSSVALHAGFEGCDEFWKPGDRRFFGGASFVFKLVVVGNRSGRQI